jgi:hypothetical protein
MDTVIEIKGPMSHRGERGKGRGRDDTNRSRTRSRR